MAERLHVLNAQHQLDHRQYEGRPCAHWVDGRSKSLPPPAPKPPKAARELPILQAQAAPAPAPVVRASADAPRTHVLDWKRRMDGYSYTVAPDGCLPKKPKLAKGRRGLTHQQLNEAFYSSPASAEINAKPQAQQRQRAGAHPSTNPFSEGQ